MPLAGFIAPLALPQTLVQLTAEALSGVVLAHAVRPGAPVLFGCAATMFDVRFSTTPLGSVEAMLLACGAAQIGRHLGLPTQAYIGLSDAKLLDAQAGSETAIGVMLAVLARINQVAGGGMLDFVNCFSTRKLALDHEIIATALRAARGTGALAGSVLPLVDELLNEGHLLIAADTRRRLREEVTFPSSILDYAARERWRADGAPVLDARADAEIRRLGRSYAPPARPPEITRELTERMLAEARLHGLSELPEVPCGT
jgi:trimethylamine--corrinoid protein Co-methyltransferase